jgi:hypothetical protein
VELPQAFSVRDENEFFTFQHLLARMNLKIMVKQVATGMHVDGGCTAFWGLVHVDDQLPSKKEVTSVLKEAGFDFGHNILTQAAFVLTDHSEGKKQEVTNRHRKPCSKPLPD